MLKGPNLTFTVVALLFIALSIIGKILLDGTSGIINLLPDTFLNLGVAILTISLIESIWQQLGSDPIRKSIEEIRNAFEILGDTRITGVIRIHANRNSFEQSRIKTLYERMKDAREIDMMGRVLNRDFSNEKDFFDLILRKCSSENCTVRILLLDPQSPETIKRDKQEVKTGNVEGKMLKGLEASIAIFMRLRASLPPRKQHRFEVKLLQEMMYMQIVRVDNYVWVHYYMYHVRGGRSPSMEIEGERSELLSLYKAEFDNLWNDETITRYPEERQPIA